MYQEIHGPVLARKTRSEYSAAIKRALESLPRQIGTADVLRWQAALLGRYSRTYANQCLHVAQGVARRASMITGDTDLVAVLWAVRPVREGPRAPRCPPPELLTVALDVCKNNGERCFVLLAALAGLRRGEILGLRAEDWDPTHGVLRVERQRRSPQRKNHRPHAVKVDSKELRKAIEWTIANRDKLKARTGWFRGGSEGFMFPWGMRRVEGLWRRIRAKFGADRLPAHAAWHLFRHLGASTLAADGASEFRVQQWLGDADPTMACTYVAMVRGMTESSVSRLAELWRDRIPCKRVEKVAHHRRANAGGELDRSACSAPRKRRAAKGHHQVKGSRYEQPSAAPRRPERPI